MTDSALNNNELDYIRPRPLVLGCAECDLLVRVPEPAPRIVARCPRCSYVLTRGLHSDFARPTALAMTALVLMGIALAFPFLAVSSSGLASTMSLASAVTSLARLDAGGVAILFVAFVLLIPGAMMVAVAVLGTLLTARQASPLLAPLARWIFRFDAWQMADVFAVGVIVSLVKLSTMAEMVLGIAFWAYLGFALAFMLAVTSLDRLSVWSAIDELVGGAR